MSIDTRAKCADGYVAIQQAISRINDFMADEHKKVSEIIQGVLTTIEAGRVAGTSNVVLPAELNSFKDLDFTEYDKVKDFKIFTE